MCCDVLAAALLVLFHAIKAVLIGCLGEMLQRIISLFIGTVP